MGRSCQTQPPLPVEYVRDALQVRQDGVLIWRKRPAGHFPCRPDDASRFNNQRAGEPAGFAGPDGRLMVRFQYQGATRRIAASRVAWALAAGEWPRGQIKPKNGVEGDLRPENLIIIQRGANPAAVGKSSLQRRRAVDGKLIEALAVCSARDGPATVAEIGRLAGLSESAASTRLGRLATQGIAASPMCCPNRSWVLTERGRALAATTEPVVLDDLDQEVLAALAVTSMGIMKLSRRVEACSMTIKRRARLLVERGLVLADPRRFYALTDQGRAAIGTDTPRHAPWLRPEQVSAAAARDVRERSPTDDRSAEFRARIARMGAQSSMATARLRKIGIGQFAPGEFDRMAG
jgi:Mn-dependent DtxR family transcriptional regulator